MKIIYISSISYATGGTLQSLMTLKRLKKHGFEPYLIVPRHASREIIKKMRLKIIAYLDEFYFKNFLSSTSINRLINAIFWQKKRAIKVGNHIAKVFGKGFFDIVYSHHENFGFLTYAYHISKVLEIPSAAFLCQAPFYADNAIFKFKIRFYKKFYSFNPVYFNPLTFLSLFLIERVKSAEMLKHFDLIISVSSSIPYEMGEYWGNKIKVLNPGISYEHILPYLCSSSYNFKEKYSAIFFARLIPEKGIFDIPLIWRRVLDKGFKAKLAIAGRFPDIRTKFIFEKLVKKYSLEKYIDYLGFLNYKELSCIIKSSRLIVYPSYLDAFSLVVLEGLAHGKPVVAYNIPAIYFNYKDLKCVVRVEPGNIEDMASKIIRILSEEEKLSFSKINNFLKKHSSWDKVVNSEVKLLKTLI